MARKRSIVHIDEEKCNGCGVCVPACAEGAIAIVDGKAKLVSDVYCDGLGACLGKCPLDAITVEEREAEEFDAEAVEERLKARNKANAPKKKDPAPAFQGCPGLFSQTFQPKAPASQPSTKSKESTPSTLANWPVQLHLVPEKAPYYNQATLLIAADCVPFAYGGFHQDFLKSKTLLIGCPKLDDAGFYQEKLARIFAGNDVQSIQVLHMEVPCCYGLVRLVEEAVADSGKEIPLELVKISLQGEVL